MATNQTILSKSITLPPWLALYCLAPFFGEVVSGSTTPVELINPMAALFMALLYGGGALLIREAKVAYNKGWWSVFLWGCAYGILEEGLCCKSFFDPNWGDIGAFNVYGRYAGVSWVWTFYLIIFHALVSISLPIYLAESIYKDKCQKRWLTTKGIYGASFWLIFTVMLGYAFFPDGKHPYFPPLQMPLGCLAAMGLLIVLGHHLKNGDHPREELTKPIKGLVYLGVGSYFVFFASMFGYPNSIFSPLESVIISAGSFFLVYATIIRVLGNYRISSDTMRPYIFGLFIAFTLGCLLVDSQKGFASGMVLVPFFLWWLYRRFRNCAISSNPA